jgi:hypothetical protein
MRIGNTERKYYLSYKDTKVDDIEYDYYEDACHAMTFKYPKLNHTMCVMYRDTEITKENLPYAVIPYVSENRVETGPTKIGIDDWPGVFIRGDDSLYYSLVLENFIKKYEPKDNADKLMLKTLEGLVDLLKSCRVG